jgi:HSP20 family protein
VPAVSQSCYDADVAFARWDPLQDLLALQERMTRLSGLDAPGWVPPVDIYETNERFVITAELSGLSRDDFQIELNDDKITLKGQRPSHPSCCEQYHRVERGHGQFSRTFLLTLPVDGDAITADLRNGVLTIQVPKVNPTQRRIQVAE